MAFKQNEAPCHRRSRSPGTWRQLDQWPTEILRLRRAVAHSSTGQIQHAQQPGEAVGYRRKSRESGQSVEQPVERLREDAKESVLAPEETDLESVGTER